MPDIKDIKQDFKEAKDAADPMYELMVDDLNFLNGDQWPTALKDARQSGEQNRPCLVINKLPTFQDQVIGDQRQAKLGITVIPVDGKASKDTAEIRGGLLRHIQYNSDAQIAYDTAYDSMTACGFGAFRIITDYCDSDSFDQEIKIDRIKNPFTIHFDPNAKNWNRDDGRYVFVTELIPKKDFEKRWPDAAMSEFDSDRDKNNEWVTQDTMRVAEYFYKEYDKKTLYEIKYTETDEQTGEEKDFTFAVLELPPEDPPYEVVRKRPVEDYKIMWLRMSATEILEGPEEWPSKYFPIIPVWGKEVNIEGKTVYRGLVRFGKDPQRLYNYNRSNGAEAISLAPRAPYMATPKQIGNHKKMWDNMHQVNYPYILYDVDTQATGAPQRQFPEPVHQGVLSEIQIADQELHDTTGLQQASLGKKSNEKSGKAIEARQREGDVGQFSYMTNYERAMIHAGKVIDDMMPRVYDAPRVIKILAENDDEKIVKINQMFKDDDGEEKMYDMTVGKYDVRVKMGPSYTTQRQEAADGMLGFISAAPDMAPLLGDLIAKYQDWPGSKEIEDRLKTLLPPGLAGDGQEGEGPGGAAGAVLHPTPQQPPGPGPHEKAYAEARLEIGGQIAEEELKQAKAKTRKMEADADKSEREANEL